MKKAIALLMTLLLLWGCIGCSKTQTVDMSSVLTLNDLAGARIGAQEGTFHVDAASQIQQAKVTAFANFADMKTALLEGEIDGYIAEEPTAKTVCTADDTLTYIPFLNNTTGFAVEAADVSVCVALIQDSPLLGQINTVLATISNVQKQTAMEEMIALATGGEVKAPLTLTLDSAVDDDAPVLKVGMECAYEPFNWTTSLNDTYALPIVSGVRAGQYADGYDVQIAKYIADSMGMRLEIHAIEWGDLVPALEEGTIDCIIGGMSPSDDADSQLAFTVPYYESNLVIVTKNNE